jgi:NAD(P)-dependent dehydrogenase (short-subunit alcohol dehydrogenase family)
MVTMRAMTAPVALVTGASRGIGKAIAVHLARSGYDVAILARTMNEGEEREHSSTVARSDTSPLPGSLAMTAALIRGANQQALELSADLLDRASLGVAVATVLERWHRIDVLVNNARYIGPGHMDLFMDTPIDLLDRHLDANVMAPLVLSRLVIPYMRDARRGLIANVTSGVAWMEPKAPAGRGGWGLGYAISKGALHRVAGVLHAELFDDGISCVNVEPGYVATERIAQDMARFGYAASDGAPPDAIGAAVAWLATGDRAREWSGKVFPAQDICAQEQLLPGFAPVPNPG